MEENMVSIVVPVYNAERFVAETIENILQQEYQNWELILVDDCSTDKSAKIINEYTLKDGRIHYFRNKENSGAAVTRNNGIDRANGRYICFIDADDKWKNEKLNKQIKFMQEKDCAFSFTSYEFADSNCIPNGKKVIVPKTITYKQALKNTTIWTSTVMFDMSKLTKEDIYMPNVRRGQDTATWWKVLKKIDVAYGLNEVLSYYRRDSSSLSANKWVALKRTWNLYRNVEGLGFAASVYNFTCYAFNAVKRRI